MIRNLFKSDLASILTIEQSVHVAPWNEETFKMCFQSGYAGWAVELNKKVIAFIIVSLQHQECHILNICVARECQQQGWGGKLLDHVLAHAKQQGAAIIYLEVRRTNQRAISLYKRRQFQQVGERKGYYPTVNGTEDALIYARSLVDWV